MLDTFKAYKNIFIAVVIAVAIATVGISGYNIYSNLKDKIAERDGWIKDKDLIISNQNTAIAIKDGNIASYERQVDDLNKAVAQKTIDLDAKTKAYNELMAKKPEDRIKDKNVSVFIKDPTSVSIEEALKRVARMKYEDL